MKGDRATAYVLHWKYSDGSDNEVLRVYLDKERAEQDYNLVKFDSTRKYELSEVPVYGGLHISVYRSLLKEEQCQKT